MITLLTIGWWIALIVVILLLLIFLAGVYGEHSHRPAERILEYLSGKRDWVPGRDIWEDLDLPISMAYTTLSRLEDEGAVVSEQRDGRFINGIPYARRYYKATGKRRPDSQPSLRLSEVGA
jgi:DNA-binding transcriptional ArsR family regulator